MQGEAQSAKQLPEKTKAQLRAERRAIQEAQRLAKAERSAPAGAKSKSPERNVIAEVTLQLPEAFAQLQPNSAFDSCVDDPEQTFTSFSNALKKFISEFRTPSNKSWLRELDSALNSAFQAYAGEAPLPPNVATLVKQLNWQISQTADETIESEAKSNLLQWLDDFVEQNVKLGSEAIAISVVGILKNMGSNPVVLTYLHCSTVAHCLMNAHLQRLNFTAVVIDNVPNGTGLSLLKMLIAQGVQCRYTILSGMAFLLDSVKVVILGAVGVLANGNVITPIGSCEIALMAKTRNIPVLVLCQTYKFCEMVMTSCNEVLWQNCEILPSEFVTGLATEIRTLPCTAVPAVLRVKQPI